MYQNNNYPGTPNWNGPIDSNMNPPVRQPMIPPNYQYQNSVQASNIDSYYPYPNPPSIRGRMISDISEVVPKEVPMDGSVSLFPIRDYSCIYAKQWGADGMIKTQKFIPSVETQTVNEREVNPVDILRSEVMSRLDDIQGMISNLTQPLVTGAIATPSSKKTTNNRKETE